MTQVGPFPSKDSLTSCIEQLAKHFPLVCPFFSAKIESNDPEVLAAKARFLDTHKSWKDRYYGESKADSEAEP
jgi:hypothetical protein